MAHAQYACVRVAGLTHVPVSFPGCEFEPKRDITTITAALADVLKFTVEAFLVGDGAGVAELLAACEDLERMHQIGNHRMQWQAGVSVLDELLLVGARVGQDWVASNLYLLSGQKVTAWSKCTEE